MSGSRKTSTRGSNSTRLGSIEFQTCLPSLPSLTCLPSLQSPGGDLVLVDGYPAWGFPSSPVGRLPGNFNT